MRWFWFVFDSILILMFTVWMLLLAYRIVGKSPGKDPKYDAWMEYWGGTFKVLGVIGIIVLILHVVGFLVELL